MMIRLDPPIPLNTARGSGLAHFVTDYGLETNLVWTVFLENGQIWSFQNPEVRCCENITMGRKSNLQKTRNLILKKDLEWNDFPDIWPDPSLDYCIVRIESEPDVSYVAKLDCPYGEERENVIMFKLTYRLNAEKGYVNMYKEFIYKKGYHNSQSFDQVLYWREIK